MVTRRLVLAVVLCGVPILGQWPVYKIPGVPRTPDGRVDLTARAPITADNKPDFSGVWRFVDSPQARSGPPPPPGVGTIGIGLRAPGLNQFFDIGSTLPDGLPFQPWAAEMRKQRAAANNKDNPDARCLPLGLMQLHTHPQPWWYGYSAGRWEGDTLVVETTGFRDDVWLDVEGSPLTESAKMTERFRRPDYGNMEI